ncbi:MAG: TRAP transporter large permease subunit [Rhodospirillaceae bacterium]|nr:TRAP transporter large permease subunit [Rhodospirillaceae bacterium]
MLEWYWAIAILFGSILFLMLIGIPVGLAFLICNVGAASYWFGGSGPLLERISKGLGLLVQNGFQVVASPNLVPVAMFLLMGELFFQTGLANRMFNGIDKLMGRLPGRLSYVTVAGGTAFAALSGSSMGSGAMLGTLMVPEMQKRGYNKFLSMGPILGTGGIAILIPPSTLAVLLGTIAELDIGKLLVAGILPGILLAAMYAILIASWIRIDPKAAPAYEVAAPPALEKLVIFLRDILPMLSIIVFVIVITVAGVASPIESSAFGAVGVLILGVAYRVLTFENLRKSCVAATRITVMALVIIFGSATFSQLLGFSGASAGLIKWATSFEFSPIAMLLIMFGLLLVLGMFMDQLSMMLLTVPIFFPLAKQYGWDTIWFGIIMMMSFEISYTTPPFGLLLFVMQGVAPKGTTFSDIVAAAAPYMACAFLLVALIVIAPPIATWLPCQFEDNPTACMGGKSNFEYYLIGIGVAVAALMYALTRPRRISAP